MVTQGGDAKPGPGAHQYDPAAYGERLGAAYDRLYPATDATVAFLAELAESRPERSLLEFGIGTGRLAVGLHQRGLTVAGIDASPQMVAVLRQKVSARQVHVEVGDYVSTRVPGCFGVVALVFNNVLDPRGIPAQLALFENAAHHLAAGGFFVVEAFVLDDKARDGSWTVLPRFVGEDHVELEMVRFDVETSTLERTLVHLTPEGAQFFSVRDAYASPGELDVMAHVNGMTRVERYSSWSRDPFTAASRRHITVYQKR
jgi:SAM-dependent methyltransferase